MKLFKGLIEAAIRYELSYFVATTIGGTMSNSEPVTPIKMVDNSSRR